MLHAARYSHPLPNTPLHDLIHFQAFLRQQNLDPETSTKTLVDFMLLEYLSQTIVFNLARQRRLFDMAEPDCRASLTIALDELAQDFRQGRVELETWSLVYHRFARVDLWLSQEQIAAVTTQDGRTLRRRQQRGIQQLTYALLADEITFRSEQRFHASQFSSAPVGGSIEI